MEKTIWDLELHEVIYVGQLEIMRVPGGWLYTNYSVRGNARTSTFIHFHTDLRPPLKM